jgi:hypothetical protein
LKGKEGGGGMRRLPVLKKSLYIYAPSVAFLMGVCADSRKEYGINAKARRRKDARKTSERAC